MHMPSALVKTSFADMPASVGETCLFERFSETEKPTKLLS